MLRAATADLHAQVDSRFSGKFSEDSKAYGHFLAALAEGVIPLERALEAEGIERLLPDWPERRRTTMLLADLEALGVPVPAGRAMPEVGGEARQFGIAYVLEGSRLGGKLLLRQVLAHRDEKVRAATRYLSHGTDRDLWPSFVKRLDASAAVSQAPDEAVAGARLAFALFSEPSRG